MPLPTVSPAPPAGPLYADYWDWQGLIHGWRPKGTRDWLLLYTEEGGCLARFKGGEFRSSPGDVLLYRPGTAQDYGLHDAREKWKHVWVHWVPRPPVLEWLDWPELSPGLRHLALPLDLRETVLRELVHVDAVLRSRQPRGEALALNALERALLYCSRANPRETGPRRHPRIQAAVDFLAQNIREPQTLEDLAQRFGFSRSRFAALFRQQVGRPPGEYLEGQRLARARHLLSYTGQTLTEIAEATGFSSPFYLSLRFKKHYGKSPRVFREAK